jgi:hypothetical protein
VRGRLLLPLLALLLAVVSACGSEDAAQDPGTSSAAQAAKPADSLPADADPAQLRDAIVEALGTLGPVRIQAEVKKDADGLGDERAFERSTDQLIDPDRGLALRTTTAGGQVVETTSTVRNRSLTITYQGGTAQVAEYIRLEEPGRLPVRVDELSPDLLEKARPTDARRREDGSWELRFEQVRGEGAPGTTLEVLLVVGPDLLPAELAYDIEGQRGSGTVGPDGVTESTEETYITKMRATYRFERIAGLTPEDVRLDLPAGARVERRVQELPLDNPRGDGTAAQYWLGPAVAGMELVRAEKTVTNPDTAGEETRFNLIYGREEAVPGDGVVQFVQSPPDPPGWAELREEFREEEDGGMIEELVVGGKEATMRSVGAAGQVEAFALLVELADATIFIQAYGLGRDAAGDVLEALREL